MNAARAMQAAFNDQKRADWCYIQFCVLARVEAWMKDQRPWWPEVPR